MTITFPRDLPLNGLLTGQSTFEPVYQQTRAITGGGSVNVADLGPAMWQADYATDVLTRADFATWVAWLQSLRGGLRLFKGRPPFWKWPQAYPKGFAALTYSGSPFTGLGNLSVIGVSRDTATINQLPNGFVLAAGDFFSIPVGTRNHLHRVIEGAVAASNALTVTIEPTIRPGVSTGVPVRLEAAYCEMALTEAPKIVRNANKGGAISFTAMQVLI